jgi:hypothetical protein
MWNYRIIKNSVKNSPDFEYGVYEVFYNNSGGIFAHDESPTIVGDSIEDINSTLKNIQEDINKYDVINGDSLVFEDIDNDE